MAEIYQLPDNGNNNGGFNGIPFSIPIGNFGNGYGAGGFGYDSHNQNIFHGNLLLSSFVAIIIKVLMVAE